MSSWYSQGFSVGIIVAWFKETSIVDGVIISEATPTDMLVYGAVFSLAFGYIHNFLTLIIKHVDQLESEQN